MENILSQTDYVRQVLTIYCQTPTTAGRANRRDHLLAIQFYHRHIPLDVIENASSSAPRVACIAIPPLRRSRPYVPCTTSAHSLKRYSTSRHIPKPSRPTSGTS